MIGPTGIWSAEEAQPQNYPKSEQLAKHLALILWSDQYVIDFGCGDGYYLNHLRNCGFKYLIGVDGIVSVPHSFIMQADLANLHNFPWRGQVLSLEVGEHIPGLYEQAFIDNICRHCNSRLIISWAVPGQRGLGHVNCRENSYVIGEIEKRGFKLDQHMTDFLRAHIEPHVRYFKDTLLAFNKLSHEKEGATEKA